MQKAFTLFALIMVCITYFCVFNIFFIYNFHLYFSMLKNSGNVGHNPVTKIDDSQKSHTQ